MKIYSIEFIFLYSNICSEELANNSGRFGLYKQSKLRRTRRKGRNSAVKSSQLSWAGQNKKCVEYDFKFTSVYSELLKDVQCTLFK